ncbi:MAG: 4a-hydroxytetrahydrobiopterin dehydratase [Gammaproteobacteria bacterium]|nr:4a-hydroxytetrahydrobiopterin dehydratase [Gammaproteobacteria bacterium]
MGNVEQGIRERLARELPQWSLEQDHLRRHYATGGWRTSMLLANGISHLAELAWHHPDLEVSWGGVVVRLRTHSENAITDKDFELAAMIEQSATWRPAEGSSLEGAPRQGQWRYLDEA